MATVGNTTTPGTGFQFTGANVQNQIGSAFTMPAGGLITNLHGYFGLNSGGPATAKLCLWDSSGTLLASVDVTAANGAHSIGGQAWLTAALASSVFVASGATIYIGWWTPNADGMVWTYESSGTAKYNQSASVGTLSVGSAAPGNGLGAYADYTPAQAWVFRSGVWQPGPVTVERSSVQTAAEPFVFRSSVWVAGS